MFLDPEPRLGKHSMSASPFFSAQNPTESPGDQRWRIKRKPLQERTQSQINKQRPRLNRDLEKQTIRLVTHTPPRSSADTQTPSIPSLTSPDLEDHGKEIEVQSRKRASSRLAGLSPANRGASTTTQGSSVSDEYDRVSGFDNLANGTNRLALPPCIALIPKTSSHVLPKTAWHRRSASLRDYSPSSTLNDIDNSSFTWDPGR